VHLKANPHTLLSRFYGLHRVKLPHGRKIHFVIMNNLFPPHRDIHETYDLKGSAIGREYPEEKAAQKKGCVLKDLNWINRGRELELGPVKRDMLDKQLKADVELLRRLRIMDYSLLIGLHDMKRGNSEGLRQDALQVFQPDTAAQGVKVQALSQGPETSPPVASPGASGQGSSLGRTASHGNAAAAAAANASQPTTPGAPVQPALTRMASKRGSTKEDASALRAAVRRSDPKALGTTGTAKLPEREANERFLFNFYQDEGGFRSTDEHNEPTDHIYYFGIVRGP
jgi:1-phosphatidylinositol-4-phosphate 5-kinase